MFNYPVNICTCQKLIVLRSCPASSYCEPRLILTLQLSLAVILLIPLLESLINIFQGCFVPLESTAALHDIDLLNLAYGEKPDENDEN